MPDAYDQTGRAAEQVSFLSTESASAPIEQSCRSYHQVTFRKKLYGNIEELQSDPDTWLEYYNNERTHQGRMCCGRTPMQTLEDGKKIWKEKFVA